MTQLTVDLTEEQAAQARKAADELGVSVEEFLRASVEEKLDRIALSFEDAAQRVIRKNDELYRRLA